MGKRGAPTCATRGQNSGDLGDVRGRRALRTLHDVELDAVALGKALEAGALDRRVVHEAVLATVLRSDEAEALGVVEPLHFARVAHDSFLSFSGTQTKRTRSQPGPFSKVSGLTLGGHLGPAAARTVCQRPREVKGSNRAA